MQDSRAPAGDPLLDVCKGIVNHYIVRPAAMLLRFFWDHGARPTAVQRHAHPVPVFGPETLWRTGPPVSNIGSRSLVASQSCIQPSVKRGRRKNACRGWRLPRGRRGRTDSGGARLKLNAGIDVRENTVEAQKYLEFRDRLNRFVLRHSFPVPAAGMAVAWYGGQVIRYQITWHT